MKQGESSDVKCVYGGGGHHEEFSLICLLIILRKRKDHKGLKGHFKVSCIKTFLASRITFNVKE